MKSPYKAILFDLFGTLISVSKAAGDRGRYTADILGLDREAWNQACFSEHHDILSETEHVETVRRMAHSLDPNIPLSTIREAAEVRQIRFDKALTDIEPGIIKALETLNDRGLTLGLISNASTGEVRAWSDSPLAPLFTTAHFSCKHGVKKPEPEIYRMALADMGINSSQALFIGDGSSNEHLGAKKCGIDSLLVTYFLDTRNKDDLKRRGIGSKGTISHIRELQSRL
ncbi:MAG: HAD family hydrolase [Candidatus Thiodiazotropha endolucinida]